VDARHKAGHDGIYSSPSDPNNPNCAGSRDGSAKPRWRKVWLVISGPPRVRSPTPPIAGAAQPFPGGTHWPEVRF